MVMRASGKVGWSTSSHCILFVCCGGRDNVSPDTCVADVAPSADESALVTRFCAAAAQKKKKQSTATCALESGSTPVELAR